MDEVDIKLEYPDTEDSNHEAAAIEDARLIQQQNLMMQNPTYNLWTSKATSCLISNYKKYRSMVGQTNQFRSLRDMFEKISIEMQNHGFYFSAQKCENKWRVLERKYKNLVIREMLKKPGRIKHYGHWEHKRALDEIFNEKKKSVYLKESEFPNVEPASTNYAIILTKNSDQSSNASIVQEQASGDNSLNSTGIGDPSQVISDDNLEKRIERLIETTVSHRFNEFFKEIKKHFEISEKNKEKRHLEKMLLHKNKLKVQERILILKEQKFELEKKKIRALQSL